MNKIPLRQAQIQELSRNHPAAALMWHDIDALFVLRLFYALDKSMEAAAIISHILQQHQKNDDFEKWVEVSVDQLIKAFPINLFSRMTLSRTFSDLVDLGVLEVKPVVRNTARQFRVVPERLMELVEKVDASSPGVSTTASKAGWGSINKAKSMVSVEGDR